MARGTMIDPRAIIDIGSNTVRMVIYGGPPRVPTVLFNEKVTARLGKGVAENGLLSAKSMTAALLALRRFAMILRLKRVTEWQCVATAAVRDASNGAAFLEQVRLLGLEPQLLRGEEEALASAQGVIAAFPGRRGVVGDLGGGSLELIDIDGENCAHGISVPLGTLRLSELRAAGADHFLSQVHALLGGAQWIGRADLPLFLVGGSWRALARYAMHLESWPLQDPHGYEITPQRALALADMVAADESLRDIPGMSKSRIASLPDAAALLAVLVREIGPSRLVFSAWGLREGLLHASLPPAVRAQDPLLAAMASFCQMQGVVGPAAKMVADWTACAQPDYASGNPALRFAATQLALAAMQAEPNLRAVQAVDWAMGKRWIGLDPPGRAMLAMTALANSGDTEIPENLACLASPAELNEAAAWGLAIRLCRKFSGCAADALAGSKLSRAAGQLVLSVNKPLDVLVSDSVERNLARLATWLGLAPQVRFGG